MMFNLKKSRVWLKGDADKIVCVGVIYFYVTKLKPDTEIVQIMLPHNY